MTSEYRDRLQRAIGDSYQIEQELGGGGMSHVFLATEPGLNRRVVIKLLAPELANEVMASRFVREMTVTARLQHPHVLPVLTTGARAGLLYYVTPFVEGESLRHRLQRESRLPVDDAVRMLVELAGALTHAHEHGVVHRDIKPENILLSNGLAVLADFGISHVLSAGGRGHEPELETRLTEVGTSLGTPAYMSPEQAAGDQTLDGRSDLYSLAVVGYEMLAGRPPFSAATPLAVMSAHVSEQPRPVESLRPDTPIEVAKALARALAKRPDDRFTTVDEFRAALSAATATSAGTEHAAAATRRRSRSAPLLLAAALTAASVAAWLWMRPRGEPAFDETLVAIAPFDVLGADDDMWREGLIDLLAVNLDGAGPIRTVSPSVVVRRWKSSQADRESALALASDTRAGIAVFGTVVAAGRDSVRVRATVLDARRERPVGRSIDYADDARRLDRIADSVTIAILDRLNAERGLGATRSSSLGTRSVAALKEYLVGEQLYRRGDWTAAAARFRGAVEADSLFAPALRRLGNAIGWEVSEDLSVRADGHPYLIRAGNLNVGLAPRESLLVAADSLFAALADHIASPWPQGPMLTRRLTALLESAAGRFPDDPEVWFKLGDARAHFASRYFPSSSTGADVREALQRSLALDSAFGPSYVHYFPLAAEAQDTSDLRRRLSAFLALDPRRSHQGWAAQHALHILDGTLRFDSPTDTTLSSMPPAVRMNLLGTVMPLLDGEESQVKLLKRQWQEGQAGVATGTVLASRAILMAALALRGHYAEALSLRDASTGWILAEAALAGAIPADSAAQYFRDRLDAGDLNVAALGALIWADIGDSTILGRLSEEVVRAGRPVSRLLRGLLAMARRDTATAIAALTVPDSACYGFCSSIRLPLARILSASRRDSAAAALLEQDFTQPTGSKVLWHLERGRVNERMGRVERAVQAYSYVVAAWGGGDRSLQGVVVEARAGLARLRPDRARHEK